MATNLRPAMLGGRVTSPEEVRDLRGLIAGREHRFGEHR
jgi:hypothetical protein